MMWTIFKVSVEFVTVLLLFYVLVFWPRSTWDLSSLTAALEGEVLATGPPGNFPRGLASDLQVL